MAGTTKAAKAETPPTETPEAAAPEQPPKDTLDLEKLRGEAAAQRTKHRYRGRLTPALLLDLEGLLNTRVPEDYLLHSPPAEGKPYHSTGLRSIQVQVDIANAVLGAGHWRLLTFYPNGDPHVCHAWVIVGNGLAAAQLSDDGEEVLPNGADILTARDGWGGVKRSNHAGDGRKGSQTNAAKRALAQLGPGSSVYRLDFDEELVEGSAPASQPAQARRAQPRSADTGRRSRSSSPAPQGDDAKLAALLGQDDALKELRVEANKGMELLELPVRKRIISLETSGGTEEELRGLIERTSMALEARDAGEPVETPA